MIAIPMQKRFIPIGVRFFSFLLFLLLIIETGDAHFSIKKD
jgi:hypothetical protein